ARAVKIYRQQIDGVHSVLPAVGLTLHQQRLLGDPVRRIGLLRISVPERFFAERYGRELGVGARSSRHDELLHAVAPRVFDRLDAHDSVVVKELPGIVTVPPMPPTTAARWNTLEGGHRRKVALRRRSWAGRNLCAAGRKYRAP